MDFIERIFGISPDGGSGAFEVLLFAIPMAGVAYLLTRRARAGATRPHASAHGIDSGSPHDAADPSLNREPTTRESHHGH